MKLPTQSIQASRPPNIQASELRCLPASKPICFQASELHCLPASKPICFEAFQDVQKNEDRLINPKWQCLEII